MTLTRFSQQDNLHRWTFVTFEAYASSKKLMLGYELTARFL